MQHSGNVVAQIQAGVAASGHLDLAQQARDPSLSPSERDAGLREVVIAYRADRSWSPLLLELLAPAIARRLPFLRAQQPVISDSDIRQQLLVEVLHVAATLALPVGVPYVERRIMRLATKRVVRCLWAEERHRDWSEPLLEEDDQDAAERTSDDL